MKKNILFCGFILLWAMAAIQAQDNIYSTKNIAGAPLRTLAPSTKPLPSGFLSPKKVSSSQYTTTVFTFSDITVFSYFDQTEIHITDQNGALVDSALMKADTLFSITSGQGIYVVSGNKPFSVLIGDAITSYVNGYFALDQSGRGTSTKLNTWMMNAYSYDPHFIIFSYEDGTQYTIKELSTGNFVYAGTLNNGEFLDFPDVTQIEGKALQVISNKPVSALSYSDQDYYVPSANGTFAGTLFYGFSGYAGSWENSITISSYANNNKILVTDLNSKDTLGSFTLGQWQVRTIPIFKDTFWKIQSTGSITAANIPFAGWTGSYAYMARTADSSGKSIGTSFIMPSIASQISVFSFDNNNRVKIDLLGDTTYPYSSPSSVADTLLQAGDSYIFNSSYGNYVYHISSQKNISVLQCNSSAGADFMPLGYALELPDIAVSPQDVNFIPADSVYVTGDLIDIDITIHNYGSANASNVLVEAYDGDPDAGYAPIIGRTFIPIIFAGENSKASFKYVIPKEAKYHYVFVKVDPSNMLVESNESNNKTSRPLKPNSDLLPPLAVTITAPSALSLNNSVLSPNPFTVTANIFNTGSVSATNVHAVISLFRGLTLSSGPIDTALGNIPSSGTVQIVWKINANKDSSSLNFYSIKITADNANTKDINRAVNIPDIIPPSKPKNLVATVSSKDSSIVLKWDLNPEVDLGGYVIYYGTDSTNFGGTNANEGDSPISVSQLNEFTITGLNPGVKYWFAVKAVDFSGNLSELSNKFPATPNITSIIKSGNSIPKDFSLSQNYPNPFNPSTVIRFEVPKSSFVRIELFNLLGQKVASLVSSEMSAGRYEIKFDASKFSSGTYLYRMDAGGYVIVKKMLLLK